MELDQILETNVVGKIGPEVVIGNGGGDDGRFPYLGIISQIHQRRHHVDLGTIGSGTDGGIGMDRGVHGVIVNRIGRGSEDELFGRCADAADGMTADGVGVVVDVVFDGGIGEGGNILGTFANSEHVGDVGGPADWSVVWIGREGFERVIDGAAVVTLTVPRYFVIGAVEAHIARQKTAEAHVAATFPGDNLVQCRDGQRSAGRRRALVHAAERAEGALDGRPSDPILG